jgi:glycosyltransferase involved in cell wall biosynthesis
MPDLSIIVPAYNEANRIVPTLESLDDYLASDGIAYEIIVVDDGSTDDTAEVVRSIARRRPSIRCIVAMPNRGKGSATRRGMLAARGTVRVMYDADGAIAPIELPRIVNPVLLGEVDVAIGSRRALGASVADKPPWYRTAWSRMSNKVVRWTLVPGIRDTQCGFKAFSAAAAVELFSRGRIDRWSFDMEILALARMLGRSILQVPVSWSDDPRSRINPMRDAIRGFRELVAIRRNLRHQVYG